MQTPAARAAFRLSRAARSTSGASRGYKSSLDWVKAGCPSPASPVATAQPLIAVNPAEAAAAATEAADLVLGPVRRVATAQTPIFAVIGLSAASIMTLNLVYTVNEYDTPPKEEAEFEEVTGRYGGAFVRRGSKLDDAEINLEPRYGGVTAGGTLGLQKTRSQFVKEDEE